MRIRLDLAYDGTDFAGWAEQPGRRTVAGELRTGVQTILRLPVRLTVAGRTDAGVHATGQVAHLDLPAPVWTTASASFVRSLGGVLPPDVHVRSARMVPAEFDARFSGLARTYAYRVADSDGAVDPLRRHDTLHWPRPLDDDLVNAAAQPLLGLHDFAAFCRRSPTGTSVRTLLELTWVRGTDGVLTATVRADAFCHSMVRSLVGALLVVGEGRQPAGWPRALLAADRRCDQVRVAPPHGLTLVRVDYPPDEQLAERNVVTRAVRPR